MRRYQGLILILFCAPVIFAQSSADYNKLEVYGGYSLAAAPVLAQPAVPKRSRTFAARRPVKRSGPTFNPSFASAGTSMALTRR
jgi:hypothetical protein